MSWIPEPERWNEELFMVAISRELVLMKWWIEGGEEKTSLGNA